MQTKIICDESLDLMAEKSIDSYKLQQVADEQRKIGERLDKLDAKVEERFLQTGKDIGQIQGAQNKPPSPWFTHVAAPLLVVLVSTALIAAIPTYISFNSRLSNIEAYMRDNGGFIAGLRLQQSALNPTNPNDVSTAKRVLETAKATRIKIDPNVVEAAGKKFVEAGVGNQEIWNTALTFVSYRSFLNSRPSFAEAPRTLPPPGAKATELYATQFNILNRPDAKIYSVGLGTPTDRAAFRPIGTPDENAGHPRPNASLIIDGAELLLDNLYARNVVIENSHVIYRGGALILWNVTFVNCTFEVVRKPVGQEFAEKALDALPSFSLNAKFDVG